MREIKFRAWHFKLNRMFSAEEMTEDQMALLPNGKFANINSISTQLSQIFQHDVMLPLQFTGILDSRGKEIYEGDILKFKEWSWSKKQGNIYKDTFVKVVWFHAGFILEGSKFEWDFEKGEVVGNIYENPELIK